MAKKLTEREKKQRRALKKELQKDGIIPLDKPRLNRKKFIQEASADFEATIATWSDALYIMAALNLMTNHGTPKPSQEAVGAAKVMKIACEYKRFEEEMKAQGRDKWTAGEVMDRIMPITKL